MTTLFAYFDTLERADLLWEGVRLGVLSVNIPFEMTIVRTCKMGERVLTYRETADRLCIDELEVKRAVSKLLRAR